MAQPEKYAEHIKKTGFLLEFNVTKILEKHGWNVITNKYYVDDVQESVREIDIVAYKVTDIGKTGIYTALIISCKKNEENDWVLLSRTPNHSDPNIDWSPLHVWSNDKAIDHMLGAKAWKEQYHKHLEDSSLSFFVDKPKRHIFAFQEMSKETGKPKNDKAIFDSVTSLMKAQTYEMNVLPERKRDTTRSVYQFCLLNVVGTDLVCLDFENDEIKAEPVLEEIYVASYIVDKKHMFSRIHFVNPKILDEALTRYDRLHRENVQFYKSLSDEFYKNVLMDYNKRQVYSKDFAKDFSSVIRIHGDFEPGWPKPDDVWLYWGKDEGYLYVALVNPKNGINGLDKPIIKEKTAELLKKYYRYDGKFEFDEMPF